MIFGGAPFVVVDLIAASIFSRRTTTTPFEGALVSAATFAVIFAAEAFVMGSVVFLNLRGGILFLAAYGIFVGVPFIVLNFLFTWASRTSETYRRRHQITS